VFIDFILYLSSTTTGCKDKYTKERVYIKFLDLQPDSHLNWKDHTDQMIPTFSAAYYTVGLLFLISKLSLWSQFISHISTL